MPAHEPVQAFPPAPGQLSPLLAQLLRWLASDTERGPLNATLYADAIVEGLKRGYVNLEGTLNRARVNITDAGIRALADHISLSAAVSAVATTCPGCAIPLGARHLADCPIFVSQAFPTHGCPCGHHSFRWPTRSWYELTPAGPKPMAKPPYCILIARRARLP